MYSHLPPEPQRKDPQIDVFPESQEGDSKPGLSNYLDEFLSAIKVFGYLERHVFHELTRTMQTRKLIAGETLLLEEEKGFCLVVDGLVQIFVKSNRRGDDESGDVSLTGDDSQDDEAGQREGNQGYQLLTEVKNGAPMSSLFSILSLFTEDVKLRYDRQESSGLETEPSTAGPNPLKNGIHTSVTPGGPTTPDSRTTSPVIPPMSPFHKSGNHHRRPSNPIRPPSAGRFSAIPPLDLDVEPDEHRHREKHYQYARPRSTKSAHPDIVARATVDTTIAIIPATAFHRLTRVYPKATAHIIQVILTRLQRVTLATGHSYLGLTSEVLQTEKLMNRFTTYELPGFLRGSALDRLKGKFQIEKERTGREEGMKGIALHNNSAGHPRRWSGGLRREATTQAQQLAMLKRAPPSTDSIRRLPTSGVERNGINGVSAGDLLTNAYPARPGTRQSRISFSQPADNLHSSQRELFSPLEQESPNHFASPTRPSMHMHRQDSLDEDMQFRESILECIFKAIGLTSNKQNLRKPVSVEQSPRLVSYDARRQKAVFNHAFGLIEPYEMAGDVDTDSVTSTSMTTASMSTPTNVLEELRNEIEIVYFPKDAVLVEQGERNPGLYYVIDGFLDVGVPVDEHDMDSNIFGTSPHSPEMMASELFAEQLYKPRTPLSKRPDTSAADSKKKTPSRRSLFTTKPGGLVGYLGTISSHRSFIDVTAKTDVYVGFLPRAVVERIVDRSPIVLLTMAKRLTAILPRIILHIDFALEWVQVNAGQAIYHQNDESDAIYIVLNGRLRAIQEGPNETVRVTGEYGQGDSVGELEVLTETARSSTIHAIRDTEMAKFPRTLFNSLAMEHPGITMKISKIIASKMRQLVEDPLRDVGRERTTAMQTIKASSTVNLRTVAIIPVTAGVPVVEFGSRLLNALTQIGMPNGITSLNQSAILNHLGRHAFSRMGKLKLSQYLADLEDKYGLVLYVADTPVKSPWTQTCISQADCILVVGLAEGSPSIGEYERFLLTTKTTARKELVLLHAERYCPPGLTRRWLQNRVWINGSHHHIQMPYRTAPEPVHPQERQFGSALKKRVQTIQAEIQKYTSRKVRQTPLYSAKSPFKGDFHRLARRLCGKSVGLVLGGGGARGIAHVGILRALEEAGVPIDIVGGTSIGAFIGALYAWDADVVPMYGRAKKFSGRMGSIWRLALDVTYPS